MKKVNSQKNNQQSNNQLSKLKEKKKLDREMKWSSVLMIKKSFSS